MGNKNFALQANDEILAGRLLRCYVLFLLVSRLYPRVICILILHIVVPPLIDISNLAGPLWCLTRF
jgi:hypothetical protein